MSVEMGFLFLFPFFSLEETSYSPYNMSHLMRGFPQLDLVDFIVKYWVHCLAEFWDGEAGEFHILEGKKKNRKAKSKLETQYHAKSSTICRDVFAYLTESSRFTLPNTGSTRVNTRNRWSNISARISEVKISTWHLLPRLISQWRRCPHSPALLRHCCCCCTHRQRLLSKTWLSESFWRLTWKAER